MRTPLNGIVSGSLPIKRSVFSDIICLEDGSSLRCPNELCRHPTTRPSTSTARSGTSLQITRWSPRTPRSIARCSRRRAVSVMNLSGPSLMLTSQADVDASALLLKSDDQPAPNGAMTHKKPNLPVKMCAVCHRSFTWRKKWERDWEHVRFCSERCRRAAKTAGQDQGHGEPSPRL